MRGRARGGGGAWSDGADIKPGSAKEDESGGKGRRVSRFLRGSVASGTGRRRPLGAPQSPLFDLGDATGHCR